MLGLSGTLPYAVFVYLCMRHLIISVLISLDQELSENVWFVWSKTSYSGVKWRCYRCGTDKQTREDSATQPMAAAWLSFTINITNFDIMLHLVLERMYRNILGRFVPYFGAHLYILAKTGSH